MAEQTAIDWYYEQTVVLGKTNYAELLEQAKGKEQNFINNLPEPDCHFYDEETDKWVWAYSKYMIDKLKQKIYGK